MYNLLRSDRPVHSDRTIHNDKLLSSSLSFFVTLLRVIIVGFYELQSPNKCYTHPSRRCRPHSGYSDPRSYEPGVILPLIPARYPLAIRPKLPLYRHQTSLYCIIYRLGEIMSPGGLPCLPREHSLACMRLHLSPHFLPIPPPRGKSILSWKAPVGPDKRSRGGYGSPLWVPYLLPTPWRNNRGPCQIPPGLPVHDLPI